MSQDYRMVTLPMTLSDPRYPQPSLYFTCWIFLHIPGMAEARDFKFCVQVNHIKYIFVNDKLPQTGVVRATCRILVALGPSYLWNERS